MDALKKHAKKLAQSINDPIERRETRKELYSHLLDSYEEFCKTSAKDEEALQLTIDQFGEMNEMKTELKEAHIKRVNKRSLLIMVGSALIILVILFGLLMVIFN